MALTAPRALNLRGLENGRYYDAVIASASKLFHHSLCGLNATGFALPCAGSTAIQPGGLVRELRGVTPGSDGGYTGNAAGDARVRFWTDIEAFFPTAQHAGTILATMVRNTQLWCTDDEIVTNVNTLGPSIGVMTEFTAAGIWVLIGGVVRPNAS